MIYRNIVLPKAGEETFFLWGMRQTGKSTLLTHLYPDAFCIDLLKSDVFEQYMKRPALLREQLRVMEPKPFVIIDEVQKIPRLLDEVHHLIEKHHVHFALCGSSARKVKRGHANLLGGRGLRFELFGFNYRELQGHKDSFDLNRMLQFGTLPGIFTKDKPERYLRAYVGEYLKEEIAAEGLVRNLPVFSQVLEAASFSDGQLVNYQNIAQEVGKSVATVKNYFEIIKDTLIGSWLPSYTRHPKRRVIQSPKFYFSDVGIVNHLSKNLQFSMGTPSAGRAFENWIHHEVRTWNIYTESFYDLSYWRLAGGTEVDFIIGDMAYALEVKVTNNVTPRHLKSLREVIKDHPQIKERILVCTETMARQTEDGILILPFDQFIEHMWQHWTK